jgi:CHASE3 domain sensor protein
MIGFGVGMLFMMGLSLYNEYRMKEYYRRTNEEYRQQVLKFNERYK